MHHVVYLHVETGHWDLLKRSSACMHDVVLKAHFKPWAGICSQTCVSLLQMSIGLTGHFPTWQVQQVSKLPHQKKKKKKINLVQLLNITRNGWCALADCLATSCDPPSIPAKIWGLPASGHSATKTAEDKTLSNPYHGWWDTWNFVGNNLGCWVPFAGANTKNSVLKANRRTQPQLLPGGQEVQRTPDWPVARQRGVFNRVPVTGISDIPIKMPFPCKSYTGRLAPLLSQSRNAAIMPTTGGCLPARQPQCSPMSWTLLLGAALTSKPVPNRQRSASGFENQEIKDAM